MAAALARKAIEAIQNIKDAEKMQKLPTDSLYGVGESTDHAKTLLHLDI